VSRNPLRPWRRVRVFTVLLPLVLAAVVSCGTEPMSGNPLLAQRALPGANPPAPAPSGPGATPAPLVIPSKESFLLPKADYFGVSTLGSPQESETDLVASAAGHQPTILEYFVNWSQDFDPAVVRESYREGALPLLTWEPDGGSKASNQPKYSLAKIIDGRYDSYITAFAQGVAKQKWPIVLRFAQEMNGNWYPWSEQNSGNRPGDYVKAWRHVHDLFAAAGATNVIWLWSPNVLRGTDNAPVARYYPGFDYVDWVGVDAYGFGEKTASAVLDPTVTQIQKLTRKPLLLAETGAPSRSQQAIWTADLFKWLQRHDQAIGFVWFEHDVDEGGLYDYRFTDSSKTEQAFRTGLSSLHLLPWPVDPAATTSPAP